MSDQRLLKIIKITCEALDDKKAVGIKLLDVREVSSITDYVVIATGLADPHLKALRGDVEEIFKKEDVVLLGSDYSAESGWAVVDGFTVMVHLFLDEQRKEYDLESLWQDAKEIDYTTL